MRDREFTFGDTPCRVEVSAEVRPINEPPLEG